MKRPKSKPTEDKRTTKRKLGDIGETIACGFLMKRGFEILGRNYLRKWGELDIIARKKGIVRFIEVKSVSHVTDTSLTHASPVPNGTFGRGTYRPEDNIHPQKLKRLARAMQTYMLEKRLDCDYQLDIVTVKMNERTRIARVELIENIII